MELADKLEFKLGDRGLDKKRAELKRLAREAKRIQKEKERKKEERRKLREKKRRKELRERLKEEAKAKTDEDDIAIEWDLPDYKSYDNDKIYEDEKNYYKEKFEDTYEKALKDRRLRTWIRYRNKNLK